MHEIHFTVKEPLDEAVIGIVDRYDLFQVVNIVEDEIPGG